MSYPFPGLFAIDPSNPSNVAADSELTIFDPNDPSHAPLALTDLNGLPILNPVSTNDKGFVGAFKAGLDEVGWTAAGLVGVVQSFESVKVQASRSADAAESSRLASENASAEAEEAKQAALNASNLVGAPTDTAIATALTGPGSSSNEAAMGLISAQVQPVSAAISGASDPLAHLMSVDHFITVPSHVGVQFVQSFEVNDQAAEFYVCRSGDGTTTIEIWDIDTRQLKRSKSVAITATNASSEGLPWFYNSNGNLTFVLRGGNGAAGYNLFDFETGVLGANVAIEGNYKSTHEGDIFATCSTGSAAGGVDYVYLYEWQSVKDGMPVLIQRIKMENNPYPTKVQSFTLHEGYIIFNHGAHKAASWVSVYDLSGRLVRMCGIDPNQYLDLVNEWHPGNNFAQPLNQEAEGAAISRGQLLTGHSIFHDGDVYGGLFVVLRHNVVSGRRLKAVSHVPRKSPIALTLAEGITKFTDSNLAEIDRDGRTAFLTAALKGVSALPATLGTIPSDSILGGLAPKNNRRFIVPIVNSAYTATVQVTSTGIVYMQYTTHPSLDASSGIEINIQWPIRGA